MSVRVTKETRTRHHVTLEAAQIIRAAAERYDIHIPLNARVFVTVPGGGDWCACKLDLDVDTKLEISWETEETTEEDTP